MDTKKRLSRSAINGMKKDELKDALMDLMQCCGDEDTLSSQSQNNAPDAMLHEVTLIEVMKELKLFRSQVTDLQAKLDELTQRNPSDHSNDASAERPDAVHELPSHSSSLADIVRTSVKSEIDDENVRREVIMSSVPEEGKDADFIHVLCNQMNFDQRPKAVQRLGRRSSGSANRSRPMKVSFDTEFDARTFRSWFEQKRSELEATGQSNLSNIHMRRAKTKR